MLDLLAMCWRVRVLILIGDNDRALNKFAGPGLNILNASSLQDDPIPVSFLLGNLWQAAGRERKGALRLGQRLKHMGQPKQEQPLGQREVCIGSTRDIENG